MAITIEDDLMVRDGLSRDKVSELIRKLKDDVFEVNDMGRILVKDEFVIKEHPKCQSDGSPIPVGIVREGYAKIINRNYQMLRVYHERLLEIMGSI